jgi:hypothetical protein
MKDVRTPRLGRELDEAELEAVSGGNVTLTVGRSISVGYDLDDWCGTGRPRFPIPPPRGLDRGGLIVGYP